MPRWYFQKEIPKFLLTNPLSVHVSVGLRPGLSDIPNWEIQSFSNFNRLIIVEAYEPYCESIKKELKNFHKPVELIIAKIEDVIDQLDFIDMFSWHHGPEHSYDWKIVLEKALKKSKIICVSCPWDYVEQEGAEGNPYDDHHQDNIIDSNWFLEQKFIVFPWWEKWGKELNAYKIQ